MKITILKPQISDVQYHYFAGASKTIAEGIILGSSGAFFLPETFQLTEPISVDRYILLVLIGLIFLVGGAILEDVSRS